MTKKKILGYSLLILFAVILGVVVMLCQIHNSPSIDLNRKLCIASDSFFFPGFFLFAIWLTAFFKRGGIYDFLALAVMALIKLIKKDYVPSGCRKAYKSFKKQTKEETRCLFAVLAFSIAFLLLAVTFMLCAKYIH